MDLSTKRSKIGMEYKLYSIELIVLHYYIFPVGTDKNSLVRQSTTPPSFFDALATTRVMIAATHAVMLMSITKFFVHKSKRDRKIIYHYLK